MLRGIKAPATKELLDWVNETLQENYSNFPKVQKMEKLGTGVAYCYLLNIIHPDAVKLAKLNHKAKRQDESLQNLKMLSIAFQKIKIQKALEIERLARMKTLDNLELAQWFYKYFIFHQSKVSDNRKLSSHKQSFDKKAPTKNETNTIIIKQDKVFQKGQQSPQTSEEYEQRHQKQKNHVSSKKKPYLGNPTDNQFQQKPKQIDPELQQIIRIQQQLEQNQEYIKSSRKGKTTIPKEPSKLSQIKTIAQSKVEADNIKMRKIQEILFGKVITKTHEKSVANSMFNNFDESTSRKTNLDFSETKLEKAVSKTVEAQKKEQVSNLNSVSPINFNKSYINNKYLIRESMVVPKNSENQDKGHQNRHSLNESINIFSQKYPGTPKNATPTPSFSKAPNIFSSRDENNLNKGNFKEENLLENTPKNNNNYSYLLSSQKVDKQGQLGKVNNSSHPQQLRSNSMGGYMDMEEIQIERKPQLSEM